MNCTEVTERLHPFADGELSAEEMEAVQLALADCPQAQLELAELEATKLFVRAGFEEQLAPAAEVDLSGVFDGVMARIEAEDANAEHAQAVEAALTPAVAHVGAWQRFTAWLGKTLTFEKPMQSLAAFAALALVVGGAYVIIGSGGGSGDATAPTGLSAPSVAQGGDDDGAKGTNTPRRRQMENEDMVRGAASVESYEVAEGQLVIEGGEDDAPVVVWHLDDEGAGTDEAPKLEDSLQDKR